MQENDQLPIRWNIGQAGSRQWPAAAGPPRSTIVCARETGPAPAACLGALGITIQVRRTAANQSDLGDAARIGRANRCDLSRTRLSHEPPLSLYGSTRARSPTVRSSEHPCVSDRS